MFFVCKRCGAQSPTGIGYAGNGQTDFPAPRKSCPNDHADNTLRMAALIMTEQEFITNALHMFAARTDAENAAKARRLSENIGALMEWDDGEARR